MLTTCEREAYRMRVKTSNEAVEVFDVCNF